ncbi:MAG TPA: EamA family transporter [Steroidobacteraceae bacterium]|nr:EamA family transporter [Steroidobacteraceae bacterium]
MTWRTWATFAALCAIWGLPYFFIKLALHDLSPVCVAWGRITLAAIVLVPIAWRRGSLQRAFAHKVAVWTFAVAELVVPFSLIAMGEQWLSSSLTGILIATVPLSVVVIAPLFGVKERIGALRIAGLAIGFCGVVAIVGLDTGHGPMLWAGVACIMVSVAGYAIGPLVVERWLSDVDELGAVAASLVVASILLLPFAVLSAPDHMPSALSLTAVVALGVLCTALALYLYFYLINAAGAARASVVAYINPAVAAVIGVLVLNEPFGIGTAVGMAMILFGSWLATGKSQAASRLDAVAGLEHPPDHHQARGHEHERHAET